MVEGVAGVNGQSSTMSVDQAPLDSVQVLATCHSLVQMDDGLVGDPLEKATLEAIGEWSFYFKITPLDGDYYEISWHSVF